MASVTERIKSIGGKINLRSLQMKPSPSVDDLSIRSTKSTPSSQSEESPQPTTVRSTKSQVSSSAKSNSQSGFQKTASGKLYTKDIDTIFSMLMLSLDLTPKGPKTKSFLVKSYPFSFLIEDAIQKIQHMSIRIISGSTRTTITCYVSPHSAILFIERFMSARLLHCPSDRTRAEPKAGIFLQPTAKGVHFIDRYCQKNGILVDKMPAKLLLKSSHNSMHCFSFDRNPVTDSIIKNDAFVYLLFQRLMGPSPNVYSASNEPDEIPVTNAPRYSSIEGLDPYPSNNSFTGESPYAHRYFTNPKSDSLSQYYISSKGVRLFRNKRISNQQIIDYSFTGRAMWQWLLDCTDLVYQSEAFYLVNLFLAQNIIAPICNATPTENPCNTKVLDKSVFYQLTDTGKYLVTWKVFSDHPATPEVASFPKSASRLALQQPIDEPIENPNLQPHISTSFSTSHVAKLVSVPQFPEKAVIVNTHKPSLSLPGQALHELSNGEQMTMDNIMFRASLTFRKVSTKPTLIHTLPATQSPPKGKHAKINSPPPSPPVIRRAMESPNARFTLRETLADAALSWLFSQYLQQNHCEENLLFYRDLTKFFVEYDKLKSLQSKADAAKEQNRQLTASQQLRLETQIQLYFQACNNSIYVMYNRFLAPSAPCELNINSKARGLLVNSIISHIKPNEAGKQHGLDKKDQNTDKEGGNSRKDKAKDEEKYRHSDKVFSMDNLYQVSILFERIKIHVYRTMENDSLPKFFMSELYLNGMKSISTLNKKLEKKQKKEEQ